MKYFIAIFLFFFSCYAISEERTDILLGQWSDHQKSDRDYNETHELLGIDYGNYALTWFKNSYNRDSVFLGWHYYLFSNNYVDVRTKIGLVTGYEAADILPTVVPGITLKYKNIPLKLDINYIPTILISTGLRVSF